MQTVVPLRLGNNDAEDDFLEKLWPIAVKYIGHVVWREAMTGNASCLVACRILIDHVRTKIHLRQASLSQRRIDRSDIDIDELHTGTRHQRGAVDDRGDVKVRCPGYVLPGNVGDL